MWIDVRCCPTEGKEPRDHHRVDQHALVENADCAKAETKVNNAGKQRNADASSTGPSAALAHRWRGVVQCLDIWYFPFSHLNHVKFEDAKRPSQRSDREPLGCM